MPCDSRDVELGIRYKMAQLVAVKVSGVENAEPEGWDYDLADRILEMIEDFMKDPSL